MMNLGIICPSDNLLQKWYNECYATYRPVYKDEEQFQWAFKKCQEIEYRKWMNANNPGETFPPIKPGQPPVEYEEELTKEESEEKKKIFTKRLWIFAGVGIGLVVVFSLVAFTGSRAKRRRS